jgi:flagellar motility protein MotE (MotC chaperone)
MKKIIVLIVLILVVSGCTKVQETTSVNEEIQPSVEQNQAKEKPQKHEIDIAEEKCMKKAYSNADMRNCSYDAMDAWFLEIDKNLETLKKLLPTEQYEKVTKSQQHWKKYQESEFEANNEVFMSKLGHFYHVISVGYKTGIVKDRALLLNSYIQTAKVP